LPVSGVLVDEAPPTGSRRDDLNDRSLVYHLFSSL
jgi:hypothetical protein